jgi:hypothetical protein
MFTCITISHTKESDCGKVGGSGTFRTSSMGVAGKCRQMCPTAIQKHMHLPTQECNQINRQLNRNKYRCHKKLYPFINVPKPTPSIGYEEQLP